MALVRRQRANSDIWPGFVDALATLLMVIIFLLMIFVVSQLYLNEAIVGRDRALEKLNSKVSELADMLALERETNADLRSEVDTLSEDLRSSLSARQSLEEQLQQLRGRNADMSDQITALEQKVEDLSADRDSMQAARDKVAAELEDAYKTVEASQEKLVVQLNKLAELEHQIEALQALRDQLMAQLSDSNTQLDLARGALKIANLRMDEQERELADRDEELIKSRTETDIERDRFIEAQAEIALMNKRLAELSEQITELNTLLETYEDRDRESQAQIADLGKRLNLALANKVQELARYRSEFFGRLRQLLGNRDDISIVGDRFVFQSEVLFAQGSAELGVEGKLQLARLALTLSQIAATIPPTLDWILQVNGHTDPVPIATARFPSNWELSAARAISVVKFLENQGIPAENLAAAGFGEHQPLVEGTTPEAFSKNRRIEMKLTQQ